MAEWRAHWRAVREHRMVERKSTHFLNRVRKVRFLPGHSLVERLGQIVSSRQAVAAPLALLPTRTRRDRQGRLKTAGSGVERPGQL
jgi:hypothetical protein